MSDYHVLASEALHDNRVRLMTALATLQAQQVVVNYTGGGDSGDVAELGIMPPELLPQLDSETVAIRCLVGEWRDGQHHHQVVDKPLTLKAALQDFTLDWVNSTHGGWENNDGGQGTVTIDIAENTFDLEHTEFYTESNCYEHSL